MKLDVKATLFHVKLASCLIVNIWISDLVILDSNTNSVRLTRRVCTPLLLRGPTPPDDDIQINNNITRSEQMVNSSFICKVTHSILKDPTILPHIPLFPFCLLGRGRADHLKLIKHHLSLITHEIKTWLRNLQVGLITHHTSHITHHSSHITHYTSHITHYSSHITHNAPLIQHNT